MNPTLHSHTHCQAAPSNAKTEAWQRVCLPYRTPKTTDNPTDEKEHRSDNITYTQAGVSCFVVPIDRLPAASPAPETPCPFPPGTTPAAKCHKRSHPRDLPS